MFFRRTPRWDDTPWIQQALTSIQKPNKLDKKISRKFSRREAEAKTILLNAEKQLLRNKVDAILHYRRFVEEWREVCKRLMEAWHSMQRITVPQHNLLNRCQEELNAIIVLWNAAVEENNAMVQKMSEKQIDLAYVEDKSPELADRQRHIFELLQTLTSVIGWTVANVRLHMEEAERVPLDALIMECLQGENLNSLFRELWLYHKRYEVNFQRLTPDYQQKQQEGHQNWLAEYNEIEASTREMIITLASADNFIPIHEVIANVRRVINGIMRVYSLDLDVYVLLQYGGNARNEYLEIASRRVSSQLAAPRELVDTSIVFLPPVDEEHVLWPYEDVEFPGILQTQDIPPPIYGEGELLISGLPPDYEEQGAVGGRSKDDDRYEKPPVYVEHEEEEPES